MCLSIVIPALDEESALPLLLGDLQPLRARGAQIIVADGGSSDGTVAAAGALADIVLQAPRGRALQLNAGAARARGELLLFLHADSRVPPASVAALAALADAPSRWGFFRVRLRGASRWLGVVARCMDWRSRLSGIATGDQGLFVPRALFAAVGGYPAQPLMEDIEICRRLRRRGAPLAHPATIESSGRRWDRDGALGTILLMWRLRLRYFLGADPAALHEAYYGQR
jgi:rSAM/selenodomain-associated transferase 2